MSSTVQPAPTASTMELFWVMTVQRSGGGTFTRNGLATVPVGFTRKECYDHVLADLQETYGGPLVVLFFHLAENEI